MRRHTHTAYLTAIAVLLGLLFAGVDLDAPSLPEAHAGETVSNVGFGRYREGGAWHVGMWQGKGSASQHTSHDFGLLSDTAAKDRYLDLAKEASVSQAAFEAEMTTAESAWYTALSAADREGVWIAARDARDNLWMP